MVKSALYQRPAPPNAVWDNQSVALAFQMVDVDFVQEEHGVRIRIFGITRKGSSVLCSVTGYVPYFFFKAPPDYDARNVKGYISALNDQLRCQTQKGGAGNNNPVVIAIEEVRGATLMHYTEDMQQLLLKVSLTSPRMMSHCKTAIDNVFRKSHNQFFEINIDFETKFMSDLNMMGCCWMEVQPHRYRLSARTESRCQVEVQTSIHDLVIHSPSVEPWIDIAPLRTLSFDIECAGRPGTFPEAEVDAIIQIACVTKEMGSSEPLSRVIFVLNGCAPISGVERVSCRTETQMLTAFANFVKDSDPDVLSGYNIQNFDFPYILDRAKKINKSLAFEVASTMARLLNSRIEIRDQTTTSNQMGTRQNKRVTLHGRVIFDVYQVVRREYTLRSYTLNNVSFHFLGEQKEDVDYRSITKLHHGTDLDRRRLAQYCLKDAELPMKLIEKLLLLINYVEMARVTGVPVNWLISRGQQVRILSQLLRKARSLNYYLPVLDRMDTTDSYEGATVIEPERGYYNQPIATLDFASLYPSIMIAHNICYTTCMLRPHQGMKEGEDYDKTPADCYFVTPKKKRGILPLVLEDLLGARKKAKLDMKNATDPLKKMVLNGRQLALKISANSVYGFTGATVGKLPCLEISSSVTAYGRQMIELTKHLVEETYKKGEHGMTQDVRVIYGDTDSVMVDFGVTDIARAMEFGKHAAALISQRFPPPIKLEFEKVYCPYLLIQKKRYAGVYYTKPEIHDKIDTKGMETIRRDNCPLVGRVMNTCLEMMLLKRDPEAAINFSKSVITELLKNEIDISMLIISKELTKASDNYAAKQAHVALAERMRVRDPGSAPKLGDRVPYVLVAKGKNVAAYEKAEDPIYVLNNKVPIDVDYYLENQLLNPLVRLLDPVTNYKAKEILTQGKHARVRAVPVSKTVGMGLFTQKKATCLMCKAIVSGEPAPPVCKHCEPKIGQLYSQKTAELQFAQHKFSRLWTECQNCAKIMSEAVECSANDCPIFYMREKARIDLEEKTNAIERFEIYNE